MVQRMKFRSVTHAVFSGLIPLLVTACGSSVVTQSQQQKQPAPEVSITPLLGAQKVAPAPPKPAVPPPPARTTPAFYYEPVGPFFFYAETLASNGPNKYGVISTVPCVQSGVFKRGMKLVFRYEILDTSTGKRITDKDGATTKIRLQHVEDLAARWTIRGSVNALPDSAWMWVVTWDIPPDYPVGSLDYTIVVTAKDGRTGTFTPPIQKTATADTRVRIID